MTARALGVWFRRGRETLSGEVLDNRRIGEVAVCKDDERGDFRGEDRAAPVRDLKPAVLGLK